MKLTREGKRKLHSCLTRMALRGLERWGGCFNKLEYGVAVQPDGSLMVSLWVSDHDLGNHYLKTTYPEAIQFLNCLIDGSLMEAKYEAGLL
jgi:hypothetical protein